MQECYTIFSKSNFAILYDALFRHSPSQIYAVRCTLNSQDTFNIFCALLFDSPLFVAGKHLLVGKNISLQYPPPNSVRKAGWNLSDFAFNGTSPSDSAQPLA